MLQGRTWASALGSHTWEDKGGAPSTEPSRVRKATGAQRASSRPLSQIEMVVNIVRNLNAH